MPMPTNVTSSANVCERAFDTPKTSIWSEGYLTARAEASASFGGGRPGSSAVEQRTHNPSRPGSNPGRAMKKGLRHEDLSPGVRGISVRMDAGARAALRAPETLWRRLGADRGQWVGS